MILAAFMLYAIVAEKDGCKRYSAAVVLWVTYMYILTEVLSSLHMIDRFGVAAGWIAFDVMLVAIILFRLKSKGTSIRFCLSYSHAIGVIRKYPVHVLIGIITFILALGTIPYNHDSFTYHLPRVAHWAQNKSVSHFATNDIRQVASPVLSSFINLHIYVLFGKGNMLLNMLQWSCYAASACLVMKLARKIGCNERWAKIASLMFMSMPIAFAEALTTQVDHFSALWLLIFAYFILDLVLMKEQIGFNKAAASSCLIMSACVAYGYLAKPSVSIGMLAMAAGLLMICIKRRNPIMPLIKLAAIAVPPMALLMMPDLIRNIITFNAVQSEAVSGNILIGTLRPAYIVVNFLKNFTFNLPNIYIYRSHRFVYEAVAVIARILNVELDHISIAWRRSPYVVYEAQSYDHNIAANPVVLITAIIALIWCIYRNIKHKQKAAAITYFSFGLFCLFCMAVRWQPWVSRFMIAYLALLCPAAARQLQDMHENAKCQIIRNAVLLIVPLCCAIDLFAMTWYHAVIMKREWTDGEYTAIMSSEMEEEYREAADAAYNGGMERMGFESKMEDREYQIWNMNNNNIEISHINVQNETQKYFDAQFVPDCILSTYTNSDKLEFEGREYTLTEESRDNRYVWQYMQSK